MLVLPRVRISGCSAVLVIENWLLVIQRYDRVVLIMVPGRRKRLTRPSPLRIVRESFPSPRLHALARVTNIQKRRGETIIEFRPYGERKAQGVVTWRRVVPGVPSFCKPRVAPSPRCIGGASRKELRRLWVGKEKRCT